MVVEAPDKLVISMKIQERYQKAVDEFVRNVLKEGVVLYERMGEAFGESGRKAELSKSFV